MMSQSTCFVVSCAFLTLISSGCCKALNPEVTFDVIKDLNPESLKYLLKRGHGIKEQLSRLQTSSVSTESNNLYSIAVSIGNLSALDIVALRLYTFLEKYYIKVGSLKGSPNVVCFPKGCINIGDVGIRP